MMLRQGRSWSGRERNCSFLNTADGRFADIAAVTGLDFADDGRGLAAGDFDRDGDLDLWLTNRTGPRLRLMRNDAAGSGNFLALRLHGDGIRTNRDAIGTRVEVHLAGSPGSPPRRLVKTVRAGDGFLSQSTKELHFGLGTMNEIEKVVIRWAAGGVQELSNVQANRFYDLDQATGAAVEHAPPALARLESQPLSPAEAGEQARIVLVGRIPMPPMTYQQLNEARTQTRLPVDSPVLVNLWSQTCATCLEELQEMTDHHEKLRCAGIDVVALSVDGLHADDLKPAALRGVSEFPFAVGLATEACAGQLEAVQRAILDRNRPLPLPSSFLLDKAGNVAVIYKGPVSIKQLVADAALLSSTPTQRRSAATPFDGRWRTEPPEPDPIQVAAKLYEGGFSALAIDYLSHCERLYSAALSEHQLPGAKRVKMSFFLATLLTEAGDADGAAAAYETAAKIDPANINAHLQLGNHYLAKKMYVVACDHLVQARKLGASDAAVHYRIALCREHQGQIAEAIAAYRAALDTQPGWIPAVNNLAWILATDAHFREPAEAVQLARSAVASTDRQDSQALDTLAVALAALGDFHDAVATAEEALRLAKLNQRAQLAEEISLRLEDYRAGRAIIENR